MWEIENITYKGHPYGTWCDQIKIHMLTYT
jgi:hypothetical protein